uniref:AMP deaminase n=1 Tax=Kalanchoe fedtschenkoi TaxID=63787 RepID=A0A7N0V6I0_KALFE
MESSSTTSPAQLTLAALVGASAMAIAAFYLHKRSVDQVMAKLLEVRRKRSPKRNDEVEYEYQYVEDGEAEDEEDAVDVVAERERIVAVAKSIEESGVLRGYGRVSSSLPSAGVVMGDWADEEARTDKEAEWRGDESDLIPVGLKPLRTARRDADSHFVDHPGSGMRTGSVGRLTPVTGRESLASGEGDSDEEQTEGDDGEMYDNEDVHSLSSIVNGLVINGDLHSSTVSQITDGVNHVHDLKEPTSISDQRTASGIHSNGKRDAAATPGTGIVPFFTNALLSLRTIIQDTSNAEEEEVCKMLRYCLDLREAYLYKESIAPWKKTLGKEGSLSTEIKKDPFEFIPVAASRHHFQMVDGVVRVYASKNDAEELFPVASATEFFTDLHHILRIMSVGNTRSACHHRLRLLEEKFRLYMLVNADKEFLAQKSAPHRDFYNIRKVDTHIHHSACMNQKHLLRFIKSKLRKEPDEVVIFRDGMYLTLKEVFESLELTGYDLNVDLLDVHADKTTFHRFDKFNLKYNPCGQSRLREIFLKQDNLIQGRFLAEVTKEVLSDLEASKYQMAEYRVSVYGRKQSEWDQLASWFVNNKLYSENAVWLIQLPRLYNIYKDMGIVTSFQNILDNVFLPLFEVTVDPNSHPHLHLFLNQVVGFDLVDDESKPERRPTKHMPIPSEWTNAFNPAYAYYSYYCYANLYTLNKLRESKGLPTIKFRPHCGEAGDVDHLAAAFLLCHNISHGILLRKSPVLQYLYYLAQIGLAMSPLSNNSLFLDYHRNPFPLFFQRGLNVSLSSDDPLQIHLTKEALLEEYSVAAKVWKLSSCDLCEIARNSVYQSGFSHEDKAHWLGNKYYLRGPEGNDIHKTNVPPLRVTFRDQTWKDEMQYVYSGTARFPDDIPF